ncbi:MAG: hypothetical protein VR74_05275 [Hyphomonas sp. BRH_c22]|nr:MAG: hypothetical protein VR74_05275 [Hyphomonas sp. BRH_c22]
MQSSEIDFAYAGTSMDDLHQPDRIAGTDRPALRCLRDQFCTHALSDCFVGANWPLTSLTNLQMTGESVWRYAEDYQNEHVFTSADLENIVNS